MDFSIWHWIGFASTETPMQRILICILLLRDKLVNRWRFLIALLLSGIMVLKKLMGMKGGGGGGGGHDSHSHGASSGWSSGGGSSGGWERRSSDLAYNAYKRD